MGRVLAQGSCKVALRRWRVLRVWGGCFISFLVVGLMFCGKLLEVKVFFRGRVSFRTQISHKLSEFRTWISAFRIWSS